MKTILVDAIHAFVTEAGIDEAMHKLLEEFPNPKVLLTGATGEMYSKYNLANMPYPVVTLENNPPKSDPKYFEIVLNRLNLEPTDVIYFEHNPGAAISAESVGIKTYLYDNRAKDMNNLRIFLRNGLDSAPSGG